MDALLNKNVLFTLLCQHNSSTGEGASLHLISKWMGVTKPTARKNMDRLVEGGQVILTREKYRANVHKYVYLPTKVIWLNWTQGVYRDDYLMWRNARIGLPF